MVVEGVSTIFTEPDVCLSITLDLLADMWDVLPYIMHNRFQINMFHCMLTLGYHGLLRPGEITYPHMWLRWRMCILSNNKCTFT